jgi:hypothetical protein
MAVIPKDWEQRLMDLKKARFVVACVLALVAAVFLPYLRAPGSREHILAMRDEINALPPPPKSVLVRADEKPTLQFILLERAYTSDMTFDELKQYYRPLLQQKGWRFVKENVSLDLARDVGLRESLFCKEAYAANLQYVAESAGHRAGFVISVSWRLHLTCNSKA